MALMNHDNPAGDDMLVQLRQVGKTFQSADGHTRPVLDGVDFTLRRGEIVALLGPSGSGKSTLLRLIAGLIPADAGQVLYRGQPLYAPARGVGMALVPQSVVMLVFDGLAEQRGQAYLTWLQSL